MEKCYVAGCENVAQFTLKNGKKCCTETYNKCPTSRERSRERRIRTNHLKPSPATTKGFAQPKKSCPRCEKSFSVGNYEKHVSICGKPKSQCIVCGNNVYSYNKTCSSECHKISISDARHKHIENNGIKTLGNYFYLKGLEMILLDSSYELHACLILDAWKINGIIEDWKKNTTEYVNYNDSSNKQHKYFPDFKIINTNQTIKWVETKGFQTINDGIKWKAARDSGMDLEVWFDADIEKYRKSVIDNLSECTDNKD
jgi:predicted nucleic acid-binding Zn ribbon protein